MNIFKKIEEIRLQPEDVRMRWVWGCVAFSMLIIVSVWFFSLTTLFQQDNSVSEDDSIANLKNQLQDINKQAPSLKEFTNQSLPTNGKGSEGTINNQNTDFQYPAAQTTDIPQSTTYSDLSNPANSDSTQAQ